jgi:hypothetical protein
MQRFMLQVSVLHSAAWDITEGGLRRIVVLEPFHMLPRPFSPKEIVNPE